MAAILTSQHISQVALYPPTNSQRLPLIFAFCCWLLTAYAKPSLAVEPPPAELAFRNFDQRISLRLSDPTNHIYQTDEGYSVQLGSELIVKVAPTVDKAALKSSYSWSGKVTLLYQAESFSYFSIQTPQTQNIPALLAELEADDRITLVQPNLLQLSTRSNPRKAFSHRSPKGGHSHAGDFNYQETLGLDILWKKTKGRGVRIALIDDGFDLTHEDLIGVNLAFAYDLESGALDASPRSPSDHHGTKMAGILFAQHNEIGIDGIAPEATFVALRHPDTWTSRTVLSFYLAYLAKADIVSCSWNSQFLLEPVKDVIVDLTKRGRRGLGTLVVFAAGNDGHPLLKSGSEASLPNVLTVGAKNKKGEITAYTNSGPLVDIFAYGNQIPTLTNGHHYASASGTSTAAAIVTGVAALLLAQDGDLTPSELSDRSRTVFSIAEAVNQPRHIHPTSK